MKNKKRKYKYKLKKDIKEIIKKIIISIIMFIADVVIYHYLGILGHFAVENTWGSVFICVGWFWLLAGQFMAFYAMWEF